MNLFYKYLLLKDFFCYLMLLSISEDPVSINSA